MGLFGEAALDVSPDILCVSDEQESNARIRNAVATHRPADRIETTTDPTVVPELVTLWNLDCVVAAADMEPLTGFDLRSSLQTRDRQLSVVVVSTEPADEEPAVSVVEADTSADQKLAGCLDAAALQQDADTTASYQPTPSASQLAGLVDADSRCAIVRELRASLGAFPSIQDLRIWLTGVDGSLERATETDANHSVVPSDIEEVVETGEPQQVSDTEADAPPTIGRTVAYPLGTEGVVCVDIATLTPAVATRLERLTTVGGACLDHHAVVDDLEARFRQTADRNRQLSQFARTVAHDLNAPLSVIYGRIELALTDESDAEMHLQAARNAAQRVDSLITDHLQTIEATDADSEREEVSVQTVAIQAWRIVDPSTARLQVEPQLETVEANAIRLQQLFENLIRNAVEHGSEESVGLGAAESRDPHAVFDDETDSVTVTIKPTDSGFAVCDDGPGVPPADREEIFESGYTTTESGSGLGLHIVSEIVDSHGWEISVTESASGGARFEVDTQ